MKSVRKKTKLSKRIMTEHAKIKKVMDEYRKRELHSRIKEGPIVKSKDQAIAIALAQAKKKFGEKNP